VAIGTPPFGSFGGGPFDVINLGILSVHFAIPVFRRSGRGTSFYYNLTYDSSVWVPVTSNGVTSWNPVGGWGWQSQTNAATGYVPPPKITYGQVDCGTPPRHIWEQYEIDTYPGFVDPMGTCHSVGGLTVTYAATERNLRRPKRTCSQKFSCGFHLAHRFNKSRCSSEEHPAVV
jgi:hypothetical protein